MKYQLSAIILLGLFLLPPLIIDGRTEKFQSHWKETAIVIDGNTQDWTAYPVSYYSDTDIPLLLGVVNDDTTLNILLKIRDRKLARMLERRGFILWLNGKGKKNKNFGILYRADAPVPPNEPPPGKKNMSEKSIPPDKPDFTPNGKFSLITGQDTTEFSANGLDGLQGGIKIEAGIFCYEIVIPIQENEGPTEKLTIFPQKDVKFGLEVLSLGERPGSGMGDRPPDRRDGLPDVEGGGSRAAKPSGMGGPGGMPAGGGRRAGMPQWQLDEWWITILLASS